MKDYCTVHGPDFCSDVHEKCGYCPERSHPQSDIEKITAIRARNNDLWMRLLEIALEAAPDKTKAVLRDINENDRAVSGLLAELAK